MTLALVAAVKSLSSVVWVSKMKGIKAKHIFLFITIVIVARISNGISFSLFLLIALAAVIANLAFAVVVSCLESRKNPFKDNAILRIKDIKKLIEYDDEILKFLNDNDPDMFLQETDKFLGENKLSEGFFRGVSSNRAVAYLRSGNTDKALEIWSKLKNDEEEMRKKHRIYDNPTKATINHNLCFAYLEKGQIVEAEQHYATLKAMRDDETLSREWMTNTIDILGADLLFTKGRHEEALDAYETLLRNKTDWNIINIHFNLSEIYRNMGDVEKQKEHLNQVIDKGNKHYKVAIAQEKLNEIENVNRF